MEKVRYHEMLPREILARREKFPAAFIGLGGLEWHGEHMAVGNDALKAERLCELAAARSGGFAFPTLWYGEPREMKQLEIEHDHDGRIKRRMKFRKAKFARDYFGVAPEEQAEFYERLIYHVLVQMNTLEMKAVCLVCGHYPLRHWARPAVRRFNRAFKDTQAFAAMEYQYVRPSKDVGGDHAAKWETSYLWYLRPDCVDMSVFLGSGRAKPLGILGEDPRRSASVEIGRRGVDLIVDGMVRKAKALLRKVEGRRA